MRWIKKNAVTILLVFLFLAGAGLLAYPTFSDWWNSFHQSRAVASYAESVSKLNLEEYAKLIAGAEEYNRKLSESGMRWTMTEEEEEAYKSELNITDSGIMGYIDIPKIGITLPIYHGIDEAVLQVAIGHIGASSLPVGGPSTHCVVSGHRGLPSAKLFTDLDKMVEGDTFIITVLDRTLTYEVDQIRTVEPTDLSELTIEEGKDLCTLVTCTPYGINTHRLLVRGHRIENTDGDAIVIADAIQIEPVYIAPFIAGPVLLLLFFGVYAVTGVRRKKRRKQRKKQTREDREREKRELYSRYSR